MIRLNVAELIEDDHHHPGLMGLDEALENFGDATRPAGTEGDDLDAWDAEIDTITARYTDRIPALRRTIHASGARHRRAHPGLSADVYIEADTDPNSRWWSTTATTNPSGHGGDHLALRDLVGRSRRHSPTQC